MVLKAVQAFAGICALQKLRDLLRLVIADQRKIRHRVTTWKGHSPPALDELTVVALREVRNTSRRSRSSALQAPKAPDSVAQLHALHLKSQRSRDSEGCRDPGSPRNHCDGRDLDRWRDESNVH